jgi:hypothetical protein
MKVEVMTISPDQAKAWLAANTNNRNLRVRLVKKYSSDMIAGAWHLTHQGIAFYDDGSLCDGQHRLAAIVAANTPVEMTVAHDIPRGSGKVIDGHAARQVHDALRIGGAPKWIDKDVVAIVRFMASTGQGSKMFFSIDQIEAYAIKYEDSIRFARSFLTIKKRGLTCAALWACYVSADLHGVSRDKISRFAEIIISGEIATPSENAALRLREYILFNSIAWHGSGHSVDTAKRAQRAIQAFADDQPLSKLYQPTGWVYPFPAE